MLSHLASPEVIDLIHKYGYVAVALGIGIESIGIPFPGETILIAASIYAGAGHLSIIGVIIACSLGAIIGDNIGYVVGKNGGYQLLLKYGKYVRIYPKHLEFAQRYFTIHGGKTVFFGRFISLLRMWAAILAGTNKMPWPRFLLYNAAGGIAWSMFYGLLGYFLGRNLDLLSTILHVLGIAGFIIFLLIVAAIFLTWRRILQKIEREEMGRVKSEA